MRVYNLIRDLTAETLADYLKLIPAKRFGSPDEVAAVVAFLASEGAIRTAPSGPRILPGVTRGAAIAAARALGIAVEERAFTVEEMLAARGVTPVVIGTAPEQSLARAIRDAVPGAVDLTGRTDFAQLASLLILLIGYST